MQDFVGELLRLLGESGSCFVSKLVGDLYYAKGDLTAREPLCKQVGLPLMVNIMWIAPA